jgi:hypothetical protein
VKRGVRYSIGTLMAVVSFVAVGCAFATRPGGILWAIGFVSAAVAVLISKRR